MKIILLNNLYPPFARGGAEKVTETLSAGLTELGHEVFIVSTKPYFNTIKDTDHVFYLPSLYYDLGRLPKFIRLIWHWFDIHGYKGAKKIIALKKLHDCELLITNNLQGLGLSVGRAAQEQGMKWIHIVHDVQLLHPTGLLNFSHENLLTTAAAKEYQVLVKKNFGEPNLAISPSNWIMALHQKFGFFKNCPATSIPNPYPIKTWPSRTPATDCRFVYIGQIEDHKGIILLLDAFRNFCAQSRIKATLTIAGEGKLLDLVKINYQDLPVSFVGKISIDQIIELFGQSSCLIVPSLCYENWPTVIIEAGLAGIPVIASDIGGNQELIHNHDYLFIPKTDILTNKLIWAAINQQTLTAPVLPELLSPEDYVKRLLSLI